MIKTVFLNNNIDTMQIRKGDDQEYRGCNNFFSSVGCVYKDALHEL